MPNVYGVPEIDVQSVSLKLQSHEPFLLVDVREEMELRLANLGDGVLWVPLSKLAAERLDGLPEEFADKNQEIIIFCHTGIRSAQVAAWLRHEGWENVSSMAGGIEAYARYVDPTVGRY